MSRVLSESVSGLWTTRVTLGSVKELPQVAADARREFPPGEPVWRHEVDVEAPEDWESNLTSVAERLAQHWVDAVHSEPVHGRLVSVALEGWRQGHEVPAFAAREDLSGWLFLEGTQANHSDSGTVCVLDPRAGSDMCAVPGLPWGRPIILAPSAGSFAIVPGWLTSSVLPLEPAQSALVLRFTANLELPTP